MTSRRPSPERSRSIACAKSAQPSWVWPRTRKKLLDTERGVYAAEKFGTKCPIFERHSEAEHVCSVNAALLLRRVVNVLRLPMPYGIPNHFNFAGDVVERWAKERPEALALWCVNENGINEKKLTFRQLAEQSRRAAHFFQALGLKRGDRVLVVTPRLPQWWIAMLGLIRLGVVPIPGTPLLTARDIQYRLEASEAAALITDIDGTGKAAGLPIKH